GIRVVETRGGAQWSGSEPASGPSPDARPAWAADGNQCTRVVSGSVRAGSGRLAAHDVDLVVDGAVGAVGLEADLPVGCRDQGSGQEVQCIADGLAEEVGICRGPGRGLAVRPCRACAFTAWRG